MISQQDTGSPGHGRRVGEVVHGAAIRKYMRSSQGLTLEVVVTSCRNRHLTPFVKLGDVETSDAQPFSSERSLICECVLMLPWTVLSVSSAMICSYCYCRHVLSHSFHSLRIRNN
jgi:hypothetical protein